MTVKAAAATHRIAAPGIGEKEAYMDARVGGGSESGVGIHYAYPNDAIARSRGSESPRQLRHHPRTDVSWPVVVETGKRLFLLQAVNLSARGAKVRPTERLGEGSLARLRFHPPDGSSLDVEAILWRVDLDGLAFCFTNSNDRRVTSRLVELAGAPPGLRTVELS